MRLAMALLFFKCLGATVVLETIVLWLSLRVLIKKMAPSTNKIIFAGVLASSATFPYLWFVVPWFTTGALYVPIGELIVTVAEAVILVWILNLTVRDGVLVSVLCNGVSLFLGVWLVGWI